MNIFDLRNITVMGDWNSMTHKKSAPSGKFDLSFEKFIKSENFHDIALTGNLTNFGLVGLAAKVIAWLL